MKNVPKCSVKSRLEGRHFRNVHPMDTPDVNFVDFMRTRLGRSGHFGKWVIVFRNQEVSFPVAFARSVSTETQGFKALVV